MLSHKPTFVAQPKLHETLIADNDALQAQQFSLVEGNASRFADSSAPTLDAILRRSFAFYDVARFGILQKKK